MKDLIIKKQFLDLIFENKKTIEIRKIKELFESNFNLINLKSNTVINLALKNSELKYPLAVKAKKIFIINKKDFIEFLNCDAKFKLPSFLDELAARELIINKNDWMVDFKDWIIEYFKNCDYILLIYFKQFKQLN